MKRDSLGQRVKLGLVLVVIALVTFGLPKVQARRNGLIVSTGRAFKVSYDRGALWRDLSAKFAQGRIHEVKRLGGRRMLAATRGGLFAGDSSGTSWERLLSEETFAAAEGRNKIFAGTRRGLLMSDDEGDSWRRVEALAEEVVPRTIEIAPSDERTLYIGTDRHGVFASVDGGESWKPANKGLPRSIGAAPVTPVFNMAIDPRDSRVAYAASEVHGIYKTTDGGTGWQAVNAGLPVPFYYRTYSPLIEISPEDPDLIYAVMGKPVDSGRITNGLYKTVNGGKSWMELTGLTPNLMIRSLTINPNDPRELFIGHEQGVIEFYDDPRWDVLAANASTEIEAIGQETTCDPKRTPMVEVLPGNVDLTLMEGDKCLFHDFDQNQKVMQFAPFEQTPGRFGGYDVSYITMPFNNQTGIALNLMDNSSLETPLPFPFKFYDQSQTSVFINSNGNLTFGSGDPDPIENELKFVTKHPRIAPLWNDMNPAESAKAVVSYFSSPAQFVVTWANVPHITPDNRTFINTFQVTLFPDGRIVFNYLNIDSKSGVVGITPGGRDRFYQNFTKYFTVLNEPLLRFSGDIPIGEYFVEGLYYPEVARRFYGENNIRHADDYDLLVVYGDPTLPNSGITGRMIRIDNQLFFESLAQPVKNDINGIGLLVFNNTTFYSSSGRLRMIINMDLISRYASNPLEEDYPPPFNRFIGPKSPMDMLAQMVGHAWGAYVNFDDDGIVSDEIRSSTERATWSFFFNTYGSQEDGNWWRDGGGGRFRVQDANFRYSTLDQYLMGLLPADKVNQDPEENDKFYLIKDPINTGGRTRGSIPEPGATVQGTRREIKIDDIIRVEGRRDPAPLSKEALAPVKIGFILVYPLGKLPPIPDDIESPENVGEVNPILRLHLFRCCFETEFKRMTSDRGEVITGCPKDSRARSCLRTQ
jgi:hypothetical protein